MSTVNIKIGDQTFTNTDVLKVMDADDTSKLDTFSFGEKQIKTATITSNGLTTISPDSGRLLSGVSITTNVPSPATHQKIAILNVGSGSSAASQIITPDSGYDAMTRVEIVQPSTFKASNIKKDVNIGGIVGTYEGSGSGKTVDISFYNSGAAVTSITFLINWKDSTTTSDTISMNTTGTYTLPNASAKLTLGTACPQEMKLTYTLSGASSKLVLRGFCTVVREHADVPYNICKGSTAYDGGSGTYTKTWGTFYTSNAYGTSYTSSYSTRYGTPITMSMWFEGYDGD